MKVSPPGAVPPSTFDRELRCPRCKKLFAGLWMNSPDAELDLRCHGCGQKWWAMRVRAGAVEPQLAAVLSEEIAIYVMKLYDIPARTKGMMYWQLTLTNNQAYHREEARKIGASIERVPLPYDPNRRRAG